MEFLHTMSNGIKHIRENILKVSRKDLARGVGITPMAICNYELNIRDPEMQIAYRIINFARKHSKKITLEDIYLFDDKDNN